PFIHALDTERGVAKCIDLDDLAGRSDLFDMRLKTAGDGTLMIRDATGEPRFAVDPRTFAVRTVRVAAPAPTPAKPAPPEDKGLGLAAPIAGLALLGLLAAFA